MEQGQVDDFVVDLGINKSIIWRPTSKLTLQWPWHGLQKESKKNPPKYLLQMARTNDERMDEDVMETDLEVDLEAVDLDMRETNQLEKERWKKEEAPRIKSKWE